MLDETAAAGANHEGSVIRSRIPEGDPESLLELVCMKNWAQARERVEQEPESLYSSSGRHNHRLVIHELCKLVSFPATLPENLGELSDDDEDEVPDQRPLPACLDCVVDDNKHIGEFTNFMIQKSHALGPVRVSFPPQNSGDENEEVQDGQEEEGRSEVHESILTVTDSLGKTPLHVLCEHSVDTNLLRVLLSNTRDHNHNPSAPTALSMITAKDSRGSTPLHYLTYSRLCPMASLSLLMDYCKPSADDVLNTDPTLCIDTDGDTPLHWALDGYQSPRRVQQLLKHSKAALRVKNAAGKTPFDQFVANFVENDWREHEVTGREAWENIQGYLKVLDGDDTSSGDDWLPIHMLATSNIDFPTVFYDVAFHYHKEDAAKLDSKGMLPLHLACTRQSLAGLPPCDETITFKLLAQYPQAAYKPAAKTKRLPIHLAVEACKPLKVIAALLKAYPNSLNVKDPVTGLWPFLLSAVGNEESIDTSYSLLRADPSIVQLAISALISKRGQRAAQALRHMDPSQLEEHSHRRLRRLIIRDGHD